MLTGDETLSVETSEQTMLMDKRTSCSGRESVPNISAGGEVIRPLASTAQNVRVYILGHTL